MLIVQDIFIALAVILGSFNIWMLVRHGKQPIVAVNAPQSQEQASQAPIQAESKPVLNERVIVSRVNRVGR